MNPIFVVYNGISARCAKAIGLLLAMESLESRQPMSTPMITFNHEHRGTPFTNIFMGTITN